VFLRDLDDRGELVVAETYLDAGTIALRPGDRIRGVVDEPGEIHNEGQLVHALRGRLDNVGLEVTRGGREITITGRLNPSGRITERQGVYASGVLFGPANFRDQGELNLAQPLMVHSVVWGSLGESLEIEKWDVVVRMNGQAVNGLADLYQQFETAREDDRPKDSRH
jgi:S1-C subfamily serine protease